MIIRKLIFCLILWVIPLGADGTPASTWEDLPTVDLEDVLASAAELPFLAHSVQGWNLLPHWLGSNAGMALLIADLDGDGRPEILKAAADYYTVANILPRGNPSAVDQVNFPREYGEGARRLGAMYGGKALSGPYQLDGDPQLEILAVGTTPDHRSWGFWTSEFSEADGTLRLHEDRSFFLENFKERRPDDIWDGYLAVIDTLNGLLHEPDRSALVISVRVGFDVYGRGIMVVDPLLGEILWHFQAGNGPAAPTTRVLDIDGDQVREIVYVGTSSCNLVEAKEKVGGYSDDHTRLYVVDRQGKEKWSRRLWGETSGGDFAVADFDGRPGLEILSYAVPAGEDTTQFFVWTPQGDLVSQVGIREAVHNSVLLPGDVKNPPSLAASTYHDNLYKIQAPGGHLRPVLKAHLEGFAKVHLIPSRSPEDPHRLAVVIPNKSVMIIDPDFKPLLALSDEGRIFGSWATTIQAYDHEILLTNSKTQSEGWEILPNPHALPTQPVLRVLAKTPLWAWVLILVTLLAMAGWWIAANKHRSEIRPRTIIPVDADHMREARLHLLEDLELSGHGAIAPLRSLRRLLWMLDALKVGFGLNEGLRSRFQDILTDCHRDDLPRLLVILERAAAASIDSPQVAVAGNALTTIQTQLARLQGKDLEVDLLNSMSENLHHQGDVAESALQTLREEVGDEFKTNLHQVVDKVLRANAQDIERVGVQVQVGQMAQAAGGTDAEAESPLVCRMDPFEMEFILDNLVGNAVRAMESAATRQLDLTWLTTNGMVKMQVKDTGLGIAAEERDHILETEFSSKERGGMGLPRSMRLLRKYGGQLSIAESAPGQGTTFLLLLPRAC